MLDLHVRIDLLTEPGKFAYGAPDDFFFVKHPEAAWQRAEHQVLGHGQFRYEMQLLINDRDSSGNGRLGRCKLVLLSIERQAAARHGVDT